MCVKTLLTNGDVQKIKEHAGEVWHSNIIESGAHDNFSHRGGTFFSSEFVFLG